MRCRSASATRSVTPSSAAVGSPSSGASKATGSPRSTPGSRSSRSRRSRLDDLIRDGVDLYEMPAIQSVRVARALGLREAVVPASFPRASCGRAPGRRRRADGRPAVLRRPAAEQVRDGARVRAAGNARVPRRACWRSRSVSRAPSRATADAPLDGEPLTCELLRAAATSVFASHGCRGDDLIVGARRAGCRRARPRLGPPRERRRARLRPVPV